MERVAGAVEPLSIAGGWIFLSRHSRLRGWGTHYGPGRTLYVPRFKRSEGNFQRKYLQPYKYSIGGHWRTMDETWHRSLHVLSTDGGVSRKLNNALCRIITSNNYLPSSYSGKISINSCIEQTYKMPIATPLPSLKHSLTTALVRHQPRWDISCGRKCRVHDNEGTARFVFEFLQTWYLDGMLVTETCPNLSYPQFSTAFSNASHFYLYKLRPVCLFLRMQISLQHKSLHLLPATYLTLLPPQQDGVPSTNVLEPTCAHTSIVYTLPPKLVCSGYAIGKGWVIVHGKPCLPILGRLSEQNHSTCER